MPRGPRHDQFRYNDYCMEVPFQMEINTISVHRVAAIIHVYYVDMFPKILGYLKNVPFQTDLFISTDTDAKKTTILETLEGYSNGIIEVRVFENCGRGYCAFYRGLFRRSLNITNTLYICIRSDRRTAGIR